MKIWKALGLAGLAGVAATGVIIARDQRKRSDLTPEEIKDRLHQRLGRSREHRSSQDAQRRAAARRPLSSALAGWAWSPMTARQTSITSVS